MRSWLKPDMKLRRFNWDRRPDSYELTDLNIAIAMYIFVHTKGIHVNVPYR